MSEKNQSSVFMCTVCPHPTFMKDSLLLMSIYPNFFIISNPGILHYHTPSTVECKNKTFSVHLVNELSYSYLFSLSNRFQQNDLNLYHLFVSSLLMSFSLEIDSIYYVEWRPLNCFHRVIDMSFWHSVIFRHLRSGRVQIIFMFSSKKTIKIVYAPPMMVNTVRLL